MERQLPYKTSFVALAHIWEEQQNVTSMWNTNSAMSKTAYKTQRARALQVAPHAIVPTYTSVQKGNEKTDKGLKNSWSTCAPDRGLAGHVTPSPKEWNLLEIGELFFQHVHQ